MHAALKELCSPPHRTLGYLSPILASQELRTLQKETTGCPEAAHGNKLRLEGDAEGAQLAEPDWPEPKAQSFLCDSWDQ